MSTSKKKICKPNDLSKPRHSSVQPQGKEGGMPEANTEKALEPQTDEYPGLPWAKAMLDAIQVSKVEESLKAFNEEHTRLWAGCWAKVNDYPYWKIALGDKESGLVDEALKAQREKKYTEPRAVVCDERTFELLCIARNLLEDESGCITPAEHLIRALLFAADGGALTPNRLEVEVDEFRDNFKAAEQTARYFLRKYPDLVQVEQEQ